MPDLVFHRYTEPEKKEIGRQLLRRQVKRVGSRMFDSADFHGSDVESGADTDGDSASEVEFDREAARTASARQ